MGFSMAHLPELRVTIKEFPLKILSVESFSKNLFGKKSNIGVSYNMTPMV
jgi:hypothetical protein